MTFSTILLILSVLAAIGFYIFIKYEDEIVKKRRKKRSKNGQENNFKMNDNQKKKERAKLIESFEIKEIVSNGNLGGVIKMSQKDGLRSVVSVSTLDFELLTNEDQTQVENALRQFALALGFPIQFFTTTVKMNADESVKNIEQVIDDEDEGISQELKHYATDLRDKLKEIKNQRGLYVRKSYCVIPVDGISDERRAYGELKNRIRLVIDNLSAIHGFKIAPLNEIEISDLLASILNKGTNMSLKNLLKSGATSMYVGGEEKVLIKTGDKNVQ